MFGCDAALGHFTARFPTGMVRSNNVPDGQESSFSMSCPPLLQWPWEGVDGQPQVSPLPQAHSLEGITNIPVMAAGGTRERPFYCIKGTHTCRHPWLSRAASKLQKLEYPRSSPTSHGQRASLRTGSRTSLTSNTALLPWRAPGYRPSPNHLFNEYILLFGDSIPIHPAIYVQRELLGALLHRQDVVEQELRV